MLRALMGVAVSLLGGVTIATLFEARKRVLYSVLFGLIGFVFLMAAVIIGVLDIAVQFEAHGSVLWSAVLSACLGFSVVGVLCLVASRLALPTVRPSFGFLPNFLRAGEG